MDGQRLGPVEDADVVQPEEAAREDVLAAGVLPVDPPEARRRKVGGLIETVSAAAEEIQMIAGISVDAVCSNYCDHLIYIGEVL